jgi:hypothetical protein
MGRQKMARGIRRKTAAIGIIAATLTILGVCLPESSALASSTTPASTADPALQAAYTNYLNAINTARSTIQSSPLVQTPADQVAANNFLHTISTYAVGMALDDTVDQPAMEVLPYPAAPIGFENPDNLYYVARISDNDSYVIRGNRGTSQGFLVEAIAGIAGNSPTAGAVTSSVSDSNLHFAPNGDFSFTLSAQKPAQGDWMPLLPGTDNMLVRFTSQNWLTERPGSISISRIGGPSQPSLDVTPTSAAAMLNDAANTIVNQASFYATEGDRLTLAGPNKLTSPLQQGGTNSADVQQWNSIGNYNLTNQQALIVTIKHAAQAQYSGFMVADPFFDTLEFVHHQTSLNGDQVFVDSDGNIRYVLSAQDPGVPNWIDTSADSHGTIFARWQDVQGQLGPDFAPTLSVVNVSDVRAALPSDTPTVTPVQRQLELFGRALLLTARYFGADPSHRLMVDRLQTIEHLVGQTLPDQLIQSEINIWGS